MAAAADIILGDGDTGAGRDTIYGGGGNNYVNAGGGDDYVLGGSGNEYLQGGAGNDIIIALAGDDVLWGGSASTSQQDAFIAANFGTSSVITTFSGITDAAILDVWPLTSFRGESALTGTGNDWLDAGPGNDQAFGQDGNDHLDGGPGVDWIEGGAGYDLLIGGPGNDTFIFHAADIEVGNWATVADLGKVEGDFDGIVLEGFGQNHANVAFYQDGANTLIYSLSTGIGGGIIVQNITIAELQAHLGYL